MMPPVRDVVLYFKEMTEGQTRPNQKRTVAYMAGMAMARSSKTAKVSDALSQQPGSPGKRSIQTTCSRMLNGSTFAEDKMANRLLRRSLKRAARRFGARNIAVILDFSDSALPHGRPGGSIRWLSKSFDYSKREKVKGGVKWVIATVVVMSDDMGRTSFPVDFEFVDSNGANPDLEALVCVLSRVVSVLPRATPVVIDSWADAGTVQAAVSRLRRKTGHPIQMVHRLNLNLKPKSGAPGQRTRLLELPERTTAEGKPVGGVKMVYEHATDLLPEWRTPKARRGTTFDGQAFEWTARKAWLPDAESFQRGGATRKRWRRERGSRTFLTVHYDPAHEPRGRLKRQDRAAFLASGYEPTRKEQFRLLRAYIRYRWAVELHLRWIKDKKGFGFEIETLWNPELRAIRRIHLMTMVVAQALFWVQADRNKMWTSVAKLLKSVGVQLSKLPKDLRYSLFQAIGNVFRKRLLRREWDRVEGLPLD